MLLLWDSDRLLRAFCLIGSTVNRTAHPCSNVCSASDELVTVSHQLQSSIINFLHYRARRLRLHRRPRCRRRSVRRSAGNRGHCKIRSRSGCPHSSGHGHRSNPTDRRQQKDGDSYRAAGLYIIAQMMR